jgi:mannose-6-phosphate isomerase-like protein (cupin superfamily)
MPEHQTAYARIDVLPTTGLDSVLTPSCDSFLSAMKSVTSAVASVRRAAAKRLAPTVTDNLVHQAAAEICLNDLYGPRQQVDNCEPVAEFLETNVGAQMRRAIATARADATARVRRQLDSTMTVTLRSKSIAHMPVSARGEFTTPPHDRSATAFISVAGGGTFSLAHLTMAAADTSVTVAYDSATFNFPTSYCSNRLGTKRK